MPSTHTHMKTHLILHALLRGVHGVTLMTLYTLERLLNLRDEGKEITLFGKAL
jgi:uncharacterized integral membrane protein